MSGSVCGITAEPRSTCGKRFGAQQREMRGNSSGKRGDVRQSALWGSGNRGGELRSNALWGKGGRGAAMACMLLAVVVPAGAVAKTTTTSAYVPKVILDAATAEPNKQFSVIVEASEDSKSGKDNEKRADKAGEATKRHQGDVKRKFRSVPGAAIGITGKQLLKLAGDPDISSITPDTTVKGEVYEDNEIWREAIKADSLWGSFLSPAPQAPAIAVVDSGVDASALGFGWRLVAAVSVCSTCTVGAVGDEQGHGTMVAGLAAGSVAGHMGVASNAPIVSVRTSNANGQSSVSDVIAAVDWIIANKAQYNIRVANFSLGRADVTNPLYDPLNHAVERLWFNVVVVASAGNHGSDLGPVKIKSPGNDPFVITAGAVDTRTTASIADDVVPAWSAHGTSVTGFAKPDVGAPGRYMLAAVPALGTLPLAKPERVWASSRRAPAASSAPAASRRSCGSFPLDVVTGELAQRPKLLAVS